MPVSPRRIAHSTNRPTSYTLERIGDMAFNNCNNLNNVYTYTVLPINIDQNTFTNFKATTLWVPFGIIFCTILHHFLLKPKLEHAVGNEDTVLLQGDQFLVDEGFLDAVDEVVSGNRHTIYECLFHCFFCLITDAKISKKMKVHKVVDHKLVNF